MQTIRPRPVDSAKVAYDQWQRPLVDIHGNVIIRDIPNPDNHPIVGPEVIILVDSNTESNAFQTADAVQDGKTIDKLLPGKGYDGTMRSGTTRTYNPNTTIKPLDSLNSKARYEACISPTRESCKFERPKVRFAPWRESPEPRIDLDEFMSDVLAMQERWTVEQDNLAVVIAFTGTRTECSRWMDLQEKKWDRSNGQFGLDINTLRLIRQA